MANVSALSIEYAHVYFQRKGQEPDADYNARMEEAFRDSVRSARPWVEAALRRYRDAGLLVSTTVMIDDYFISDPVLSSYAAELVREICSGEGLPVDHLVFESGCADATHQLLNRLLPEPRMGDGSSRPPQKQRGTEWLSNGDPGRSIAASHPTELLLVDPVDGDAVPDTPSSQDAQASAREGHGLHLDVQLWKADEERAGSMLLACPALAAGWQALRLGLLSDDAGNRLVPTRIDSSPDAAPFHAARTLNVLSLRYLEIEHAVRTILSQVALPSESLRRLQAGPEPPSSHEHLERIAYVFVPDGFEPTKLRFVDGA